MIHIKSFGYKFGKPPDLKHYLNFRRDCRKIRNPWNVPGMRKLTGLDPSVQSLVENCVRARKILSATMVVARAYNDDKEHNFYFGCTGGKHRSVAMAELLAKRLTAEGIEFTIEHRDLYADSNTGKYSTENQTTQES